VLEADSKANASQRRHILSTFENTKGAAVLVTTRIFSQGVNIDCANHTILAYEWWNPVIMDQSESRTTRPGQKKSVFIVKIIIRDTVEELMWTVAECKRKIGAQFMKGVITPQFIKKVTMLDAVDMFKNSVLLLEDLYLSTTSSPSSSSSSSSSSSLSSQSTFSIDDPKLFRIMQSMLKKSANVYIDNTTDLHGDHSHIPPTVNLTPFVSEIKRTVPSSSSSSSSNQTPSRLTLPPVKKLARVNTLIRGNYHYRRFTPMRDPNSQYQRLISVSSPSRKRQVIEIDDFGRVIHKEQRVE
jgi:hypothetical protein